MHFFPVFLDSKNHWVQISFPIIAIPSTMYLVCAYVIHVHITPPRKYALTLNSNAILIILTQNIF